MALISNRIRCCPRTECGAAAGSHGEVLATQPPQLQPLPPTPGGPEERWLSLRDRLRRVAGCVPFGELEQKRRNAVAALVSNSAGRTTQQRPGVRFKEAGNAFDGINIDVDYLRSYPKWNAGSHLSAYSQQHQRGGYGRLAARATGFRTASAAAAWSGLFESQPGVWSGADQPRKLRWKCGRGRMARVHGRAKQQSRSGKDRHLNRWVWNMSRCDCRGGGWRSQLRA